MKESVNTIQEREAIVAEYLLGRTSYRKLADKYDVDFRAIHRWVISFQNIAVKKQKHTETNPQINQTEQYPTEVKQLQEELRKARLHNNLLNTIIDIAEDQLKIDIRKKSGTKR